MSLTAQAPVDCGDLAAGFNRLVQGELTVATLVFDTHQQLRLQSPDAARMLGLEGPFAALQHAKTFPQPVCDLVQKALHTDATASNTQLFQRQGTPPLPLRLTALPLMHADGRNSVAVFIQDVSLARRLEADMRQLDRLASVGTLAAEMAHEVRNALVAVKTFVDLLLEQNPQAELGETVQREIKRMDAIVAQVLKYSRPSAADFSPTGIHELLERTLQLVRPRCDGRNITVVTRFAAQPDLVHGNEGYLEQAILNLLLNATEAMTGDGTLTVETDRVAGVTGASLPDAAAQPIRIVIRDTGAGIASEHLARLFEPFFTTKPNGTGLGLAITRRIVHEHRGLITAESEPGRGTAFQILLPAA
jgi:two-component system nitrogen regulation sensor histidine kinase GlnL